MILVANSITKFHAEHAILQSVGLTIYKRERLAIIGETGSGKTTLLRALAGLIELDAGEIIFEGNRVKGPSEVLLPGHSGISYLHQAVNLRNHYKVKDLLERHSIQDGEADRKLAAICRIDHLLERMTDQLSGGERQRIALAIELSKHPSLLLLDEPFSNLDIGHRNTLKAVLDTLHQEMGLTLAIVSHNPSEVLGWADRMLVLRQGNIIQEGTPRSIYDHPIDEYTACLLGPYNYVQLRSNDIPVFIRPEKLGLSVDTKGDWKGQLIEEEFDGHSSLYTVKTDRGNILVRDLPGHPIGREVCIFIHPNTEL
jgi:iron(III) transport system ATP-binding protein